jgi:phosphoribosyl-ATP pyrophosphohydrolase
LTGILKVHTFVEKKEMQELVQNIHLWATERNLLKKENRHAQLLKVAEELGETARAILKSNQDGIKDGLGDLMVTLMILTWQRGDYPILAMLEQTQRDALHYFDTRTVNDINTFIFFKLLAGHLGGVSFAQHYYEDCLGQYEEDLAEAFSMIHCLAKQYHLTSEECLQAAYEEIKDRKGKTVNGTFIKE